MARERMITRTINTTVLEIIGVNLDTLETERKETVWPGRAKDIKYEDVESAFQNDHYAVATIHIVKEVESLYGMPESDFIAHAKIMPPRTTVE